MKTDPKGVLSPAQYQIYLIGKRDGIYEHDKGLVIIAVLSISEYDLEEDVEIYLDEHPDATFMELDDYIVSLCPPLEIVDDDEMDDED